MKKVIKKENWKLAGNVTVDAGIVHIGDPCYLLQSAPTKTWRQYRDEIKMNKNYNELNHKRGPGLGVVVSSGLGDGIYQVYVKEVNLKRAGKRVAEAKIVFLDEDMISEWNKT